MITRRSFLTALTALPFVGKMIPQPEQPLAFLTEQMPLAEYKLVFYGGQRAGKTTRALQQEVIYWRSLQAEAMRLTPRAPLVIDPNAADYLSGDVWPESARRMSLYRPQP